ncbi:MAG: hypothetical protein ACRDQZ_03985 [Mycobacteriales bacterium]
MAFRRASTVEDNHLDNKFGCYYANVTAHAAIRVSPELRDRIAALAKREGRSSYVEEVAFLVKQREEQLWWEAIRDSYRKDASNDPSGYIDALAENQMLIGSAPAALADETEWPEDMVIDRDPAEQAQLERDRA